MRMHVIDPMHNLLLGTTKHIMEMWTGTGLLSNKNLKEIELIVSSIIIPHDAGRIPNKIASSFSGFTAHQWRNWCVILSPIICTRTISLSKVNEAHHYFKQFISLCTNLKLAQLICTYTFTCNHVFVTICQYTDSGTLHLNG